MKNEKDYTPYYELETTTGRIGLCICKKCGATIILDRDNAPYMHDKWHEKLEEKKK